MSELISSITVLKFAAVLHALFFGLRAVYIFSQQHGNRTWKETYNDVNSELKERPDYFFYQFVFNFSGVLVGYFALYVLWSIQASNYGWEELIILLVAFVGITGNLPWFVMLKGFPGK